jgi:eukaryotic-like serine/threonine-protein kinase
VSTSPQSGPLLPGDPRRIGRWRLLGRLGAGGMGVVYLGVRRKQHAAIKVLRADLAHDADYRERFRREAESAARVSSVNTARVLEIHDTDPMYLATEYVAGPTLSQALAAGGPLRGPALRDFARGVADAIAAIHAAGVTHRDLTPANVILDGRRPVVIDFGIARADDNRTMTATGWAMGTPGWMAPEQARGERAGPPADVFAWGLLVAFAGTGRPPFGTGRPDAVVYRIVHETPDVGGIDHELVPIVLAALEKDPQRRPRPEPVLHELLALDGIAPTSVAPAHVLPTAPAQPPVASPPPVGPPPEPPVHARRAAAAPPPRDRSAPRRVLALVGVLALLVAAGVGGVWLARLGDGSPAAADPELPTVTTGAVVTTPSTAPPTTTSTVPATTRPVATGDVESYCDAADAYYATLDDYTSGLGLFADQDERDEAFLDFAAENQDLGAELLAGAPADIADDVAVVVDAFRLAGDGDLSGYDTDEYAEARDSQQDFELLRCAILRFD